MDQSTIERNELEGLRGEWIPEQEYLQLQALLKKGEKDLVDRFVELQLSLRLSEERDALHVSLELEKELENYVKNSDKSDLLKQISLREHEEILHSFLRSLGLTPPPIALDLSEARFVETARQSFLMPLKEKLSPKERILLENLIENPDLSFDEWEQVSFALKQVTLWEEIILGILHDLEKRTEISSAKKEDLLIQLDFFEKQISAFHKEFGKRLIESILPPFSELVKSYFIGRFRGRFQEINNAYQALQSRIFQKPSDPHLCCMCNLSDEEREFWEDRPDPLELSSLEGHYTHAGGSQTSLLIFTCGGGKGHLSVTKAMTEYAKGKHHIQVANTLEETLASSDVFKRMLMDFSGERLYNHLLKNEEFEWLKVVTSVGPFFLMMQQESIEQQIREEVLKQNPDILITCFPCMSAMFLNVAKEFNLPLLIVTTDLDTDLFTKGMHMRACDLSYSKWRVTLPYDTPEMRAIMEKRIPPNKIHISGFPLRPAFRETQSDEAKEKICTELGIEEGSRVLLVMIGGVAGRATEKYAEIMAHFHDIDVVKLTKGTLHVFCLCGDQHVAENRQMRYRINALKPRSSRVKIEGLAATSDTADLMSIADALITKPGGCTTNEALAKGLPMIFHAPFALMDWEVFNMEFCLRAHMGSRFKLQSNGLFFHDGMDKNKQKLLPLIKEAFSRRKEKPNYLFEMEDFGKEFLNLVDELIYS